MICPSCGYDLQKLTVQTDSGGNFEVDHCGRCQGTWFDPFELNRMPYYEVVRLSKLAVRPKSLKSILDTRLCPRCRVTLSDFEYDISAARVKMLKCPSCNGLWASQRNVEEIADEERKETDYRTGTSVFPSLTVGFAPFALSLLLLLSTFLTINTLQDQKEMRTRASEMIRDTVISIFSPTSVSVSFSTSVPVKSEIEYGPSRFDFVSRTVSEEFKVNHSVMLSGLAPGEKYFYRLNLTDLSGNRTTTDIRTLEE